MPISGARHRAGLAHHRIGGIAIIHRTDLARSLGDTDDFFALVHCHRHRLFAQHVETSLKEGLGDLKMRGVRGGDGDQIDTIRPPLFARKHLGPIAIGAVGGDAQPLRIIAPCFRPMIKRTSGKLEVPISQCAQTMRG